MVRANSKKLKSNAITYKGYFHLPAVVLNHPDFTSLSGSAVKLLTALGAQYKGYNNGDLCASLSVLRKFGWNSNSKIQKARDELIEKGLIIQTRWGGRNIGPNLYAITWQPIDECGGKLEAPSTTASPRSWKGQ